LPVSKPSRTTTKYVPVSYSPVINTGTYKPIFIQWQYTTGKPVTYVYPTYQTRSTTPFISTTTPKYLYAEPAKSFKF